jgi:hypothetical protein
MTRGTFAAAAAALLLAACSGGDEGDAGAAGNTGASGAESAAPDAGGGEVAMTPGEWEMTVQVSQMSVPGVPEGAMPSMPATTMRTCLTAEQASQPTPGFLTGQQDGSGADCSYENYSTAGGRVQGTVQCRVAEGTMRTTLDGQITPTSFEMNQQTQMSGGGMPETRTESRVTGRRIGDCPAG